nr:tetratricopeptide repeat protein [Azospirillum sp. SYSU D00513]
MTGITPSGLEAALREVLALIQAGRPEAAESACRALADRFPDSAEAHHLHGLAALIAKNGDAAVLRLSRAVALAPHAARFHANLGTAQQGIRASDRAERSYRRALHLEPGQAEAAFNYANLLVGAEQPDMALSFYRRAVTLQPDRVKYWCSLGNLHLRSRREIPALRAYGIANVAAGGAFIDTAVNQGMAYQRLNQLPEALAQYERTLAAKPGDTSAHWNRALALLVSGRLKEGWEEYEWRWKLAESQPRGFAQPLWAGEPLNGRVLLLHAEQGLGDTLHFARYLPMIEGHLILECQPPLCRLLSVSFPDARIVESGDPLPPFDLHLPLMSLPRVFRTGLDSIPASVPYLRAPDLPLRPAARPGTLAVGVVWGGDPAHRNDRQRSLGRDALEALLDIPQATFFSLQKGNRGAELAEAAPTERPVLDLGPMIGDMADTAALIRQLDAVVTVDTSVAHLAGALGRPVCIMLPYSPDWRWLLDRSDSPWYPTAKLFRQAAPGDWLGVVRAVADHLAVMGASRHPLR